MIHLWPARLASASARHPRRVLALAVLAGALAIPGLVRLELRTDGRALVPPDDPVVAFDAEVRAHFGLRDPVVVVIESHRPEGIYHLGTLRAVQELSDELKTLPGVEARSVVSLATEKRDRLYPGTLKFRPYLDPLPTTDKLLALLKEDVEAAQILYGTLVSADGKATCILVGAPNAVGQDEGAPVLDRTAFVRSVERLAARFRTADESISVVGAPVAEALLGDHVLQDLALLQPLAVLVIAFVLWRGTRRWWCVTVALAEIAVCIAATLGIMGWTGVPLFLSTAVLPVILVTVGLADEIHLFWRHQRELANAAPGAAHLDLIESTFRHLGRPIALTAATTATGFLSFLGSSIPAVRSFGLFAALGVGLCMLWSLTVIPACLALLGPERLRRPLQAGEASGSRVVRWLAPMQARPAVTLAGLGLLTVGLGLGLARLEVQDSWIDGFAPSSPFRQQTDRANQLFHGTHILQVHLALEPPAPSGAVGEGRPASLVTPGMLATLGELEAFARAQPRVGGVIGPHSQMTTVAFLWLGRRPGARAIPESQDRLDLVLKRFDMGRGIDRRREVIDDDQRRALVTVFLKSANYQDTAALMRALRGYERQHLAPLGVRMDFAGDVAVSQAMIPAIVQNQISSVVLAPLFCFLAIALLYGSLSLGLLAVVPATLAVAWVLGGMGWFGVPLGVATSMFCAITLGIAVDYAIHYLERYRGAKLEGASDPVGVALWETGPPILSDTLAIALGFGLLAFSQVPATSRLGLLVAAALLTGSLLTLGGLGALLRLRQPATRASEATRASADAVG